MNLAELRETLASFHEASFRWALGRCAWDQQEAQDVLQESYLKVIDGRAKFGGRASPKTWFFSVIRNTAAEHRRRRRLRSFRFLGFDEAPQAEQAHSSEPMPDHASEGAQQRERLIKRLRQLPGRQQEILELVFFHDLTIEEAAGLAGVSLGSARVHYERGKKKLRSLLQKEEIRP